MRLDFDVAQSVLKLGDVWGYRFVVRLGEGDCELQSVFGAELDGVAFLEGFSGGLLGAELGTFKPKDAGSLAEDTEPVQENIVSAEAQAGR